MVGASEVGCKLVGEKVVDARVEGKIVVGRWRGVHTMVCPEGTQVPSKVVLVMEEVEPFLPLIPPALVEERREEVEDTLLLEETLLVILLVLQPAIPPEEELEAAKAPELMLFELDLAQFIWPALLPATPPLYVVAAKVLDVSTLSFCAHTFDIFPVFIATIPPA